MGRPKRYRTPEEEAAERAKKRAIGHAIGEHVVEWMNAHFNEIALIQELKKSDAEIDRLTAAINRYAYADKAASQKEETQCQTEDTRTDFLQDALS